MKTYKIKFSSVTYALKAKGVLEKAGYKVNLNKNSNPSAKDGCGYSIKLKCDIDRITMLLDINRIKYLSYEMVI